MSKLLTIYVLKLESDKYYVGKTFGSVNVRITQHFENIGSIYTQKYKPIDVIETISDADDFDEDKITKKYMLKYGIDNVRGGSYTSIELSSEQLNFLNKEFETASNLCYECGKKDHFVYDCDQQNNEEKINEEKISQEKSYYDPNNKNIQQIKTFMDQTLIKNEIFSQNGDKLLEENHKNGFVETKVEQTFYETQYVRNKNDKVKKIEHQIEVRKTYISGSLVKLESWYRNGNKQTEVDYNDGNCSKNLQWYENGNQHWEINNIDGKHHGKQYYWFENGLQSSILNYYQGKQDGLQYMYFQAGNTYDELHFINGISLRKKTKYLEIENDI